MTSALAESATQTAEVWRAYAATRQPGLREKLLLQYAPLVKYVVNRMAVRLPSGWEYEDLLSTGVVGLIEAADRYDPERGTSFECYAVSRIRGAIIDHLRTQGVISRSAVRRAKYVEDVLAYLETELGRPAQEEEVAAYLGIDVATLRQQIEATAPTILSLDWSPPGEDGETLSLADSIPDQSSPDPLAQLEDEETLESLAEAIGELPERERMVVSLYYHDGLTMKEIGRVLDITESRVSQIHSRAVLRLRGKLRARMHPRLADVR